MFSSHILGVLGVLGLQHLGVLTISPAFRPLEQQKFLGVLNPSTQWPHLCLFIFLLSRGVLTQSSVIGVVVVGGALVPPSGG